MNIPIYLKNILYLIGVCVIGFLFLLINYFHINSLNHSNNIEILFDFADYIYSIHPIFITFIFIISTVILDIIQKTKLFYSIGLNLDRFALRDIGIGGLIGIISVIFLLIILYLFQHSQITIDEIFKSFQLETIIIILFLAFNEELFFRGYIFQNIYKKNNSIMAILISSLFFALAHIGWDFDFIYIMNVFIAGVLLCVMYVKTKSL
jgi:membrane protease YdiL (CAAX protease family)